MNNEIHDNTDNRPNLAFYHPNARGTGCAVKFALHPASAEMDGCILLRMANQKISPEPRSFSSFDWENEIKTKFFFNDICLMLQVLRGETESVSDGKGMYHASTAKSKIIRLSHSVEPVCCYCLEVTERNRETEAENKAKIVFNPAEALGLCEVFAGSLTRLVFG